MRDAYIVTSIRTPGCKKSKGAFKEALLWAERAVKQEPDYIIGNVHLCSVYYLLGREEEAHLQAKKVLKLKK